jgi:hypothetical protein
LNFDMADWMHTPFAWVATLPHPEQASRPYFSS